MKIVSFDCGLKSMACVVFQLQSLNIKQLQQGFYVKNSDAQIESIFTADIRNQNYVVQLDKLRIFINQCLDFLQQDVKEPSTYILVEKQCKNNTKIIQSAIVAFCLAYGIAAQQIKIMDPKLKLQVFFGEICSQVECQSRLENPTAKQLRTRAKYLRYKNNKQAAMIQFDQFKERFQPSLIINKQRKSDISDAFLQGIFFAQTGHQYISIETEQLTAEQLLLSQFEI